MRRLRILAAPVALALLLAACKTDVYTGLTQREANEMVAVLSQAGIEATRALEGTTYKITVEEKELARSVEVLKRAGYPRQTYQTLGEIFKGDGMIVSPYEQRIRMMFAMNQEVSQTLSTIKGVSSSRVHIVVPELDLRGIPMNRPSASVVIHHRPDVDVVDLAAKVKTFVAAAVQGLNQRDVAVSFFAEGSAPLEAAPKGAGAVPGAAPGASAGPSPAGAPGAGAPAGAGSAGPASGAEEPPADGFGRFLSLALWFLALCMGLVGVFLSVRHKINFKPKRKAAPAEAGA